jgi:hypothetical protein
MLQQYANLFITLALVGVLAGCGEDPDKQDLDPCTTEFVDLHNDLRHLYAEIKRPKRAPYRVLQEALAACDSLQYNHSVEFVCAAKRGDLDVQVRAADHGWFCWHVRHLSRQPHPEWIVSQNSAAEPDRLPSAPPT